MSARRLCRGLWVIAAWLAWLQPAAADVYPIILRGKVVMEDGSPPPITVQVERICSDVAGTAPGPITNKKGEYVWRMEIDPLATRECYIRASHAGYSSSQVEVQGVDTTKTMVELPNITLSTNVVDASAIRVSENNLPARAKSPFSAAMKALDTSDFAGAARELEAAVKAAPKFAQGWHALGVVDQRLHKDIEAREAYEHAIAADPKMLPAYVMLARVCIRTRDWQGAEKAAGALIKGDSKRNYPEGYLHLAVAQYELKDLGSAQASAEEAIRLDPAHKRPREEYVLGRILEAKGDMNGAREHMTRYLQLDPAPADVDLVRGHLENLGKPEAAAVDPDLEPM